MRRILSTCLALAVSATLVFVATSWKHSVTAVHAQGGCSVGNVAGNYGFTFSGFGTHSPKGHGASNVPFYGEGLGTSDGAGNFSAVFDYSFNGKSSTGTPYTATYTVNSDCTGLLTATPGSGGDDFAFVIVSGGAEILATDLTLGNTLSLDLKKQ
jgi:hypothetical protein